MEPCQRTLKPWFVPRAPVTEIRLSLSFSWQNSHFSSKVGFLFHLHCSHVTIFVDILSHRLRSTSPRNFRVTGVAADFDGFPNPRRGLSFGFSCRFCFHAVASTMVLCTSIRHDCTWHNATHQESQCAQRERHVLLDSPVTKRTRPLQDLASLQRKDQCTRHGTFGRHFVNQIREEHTEVHDITQCRPWSVRKKTGKLSFHFCLVG